MATVALYGSGSTVATVNDSDRAVAVTTATNDLIVLVLTATGQTDWAQVSVTDSQGGNYSRVASSVKAGSADMASVWVRTSLVASGGGCTITADFQSNSVTHSGASLSAYKVTGMVRSGLGAVRQSAVVSNQSAGTPTPVLGASALTTNPLIGYAHNATNPAGLTPRASWTEQLDAGYSTPTTGVHVMTRNSGETSDTIEWGGNSASAYSAGVIELDASPLGTVYDDTLTESITAAQTFANAMTIPVSRSEGLTAGEALDGTGGVSILADALSESVVAADIYSGALEIDATLTEGLTGADSYLAPIEVSLPAIRTIQWALNRPTAVTRSGWTGARTIIASPWSAKWQASVELAAIQSEAQAGRLRAFFAQRKGKIVPFRLLATTEAQNANTGVTVDGTASQGASSFDITGYSTALSEGEFVTVNGQLLCLTEDQDGDTITFEPRLRRRVLSGATVETARPYAYVHLSQSAVGWGVGPRRIFNAQFECEEAILEGEADVPIPSASNILLEDGSNLLLESGDYILME